MHMIVRTEVRCPYCKGYLGEYIEREDTQDAKDQPESDPVVALDRRLKCIERFMEAAEKYIPWPSDDDPSPMY